MFDYNRNYAITRKLFAAIIYRYPDLKYQWVKHFDGILDCHFHALLWRQGKIDTGWIIDKFFQITRKYCPFPAEFNDVYCQSRDETFAKSLWYIFTHNCDKRKALPPWGLLCGHISDGNAIYRNR
jgi:hypothetical protein